MRFGNQNCRMVVIKMPTLVSIVMVLSYLHAFGRVFAAFTHLLLIFYIGFQLGPNLVGLECSILEQLIFLVSCSCLDTLLSSLAHSSQRFASYLHIVTSFLSNYLARLLYFGILPLRIQQQQSVHNRNLTTKTIIFETQFVDRCCHMTTKMSLVTTKSPLLMTIITLLPVKQAILGLTRRVALFKLVGRRRFGSANCFLRQSFICIVSNCNGATHVMQTYTNHKTTRLLLGLLSW